MKKLLWMVVFLCLSSLLASSAMAGRTDRLCYDFDSRTARVKERIAWNEKMLYDDLAGLKQDRAITQRNPRLAPADEKLALAMRLCNDALTQVQILKSGCPGRSTAATDTAPCAIKLTPRSWPSMTWKPSSRTLI